MAVHNSNPGNDESATLEQKLREWFKHVDEELGALKGDIARVQKDVSVEFTSVKEDIRKVESDLQASKEEILHEFHVVAEQIRHDALGALSDAIELIRDMQSNHEPRIRRLEERVGLAA